MQMSLSPGPLSAWGILSASLVWISVAVGTVTAAELDNPFFAFDNGVGRGSWTPQQQAETLHALGYAGIGYTGTDDLAERLQVFASNDLAVFSLYVHCYPGGEDPYPPNLEQTLKQLAGTQTMLWLTVQGKADDEDAARVVREIADAAGKHQVQVALYPHFGYHVATTRDAVRIVKKVDRSNAGVSINLCHELRAGNGGELGDIVREAAPHLFLVSVNGAELSGDWTQLIQPLGQGAFDVSEFLQQLHQAGYAGPIGLQGYNIKGDPGENLSASMQAWKTMITRPETGKDLP